MTSLAQYNFEEFIPANEANTIVCAAELDSRKSRIRFSFNRSEIQKWPQPKFFDEFDKLFFAHSHSISPKLFLYE